MAEFPSFSDNDVTLLRKLVQNTAELVALSTNGTPKESNYPEAVNYSALPSASDNSGEIYAVLSDQGSLWYKKPQGLYLSNGFSWGRISSIPDSYFSP